MHTKKYKNWVRYIKAVPEIFSVKIGKNFSSEYKGKNKYIPDIRDHLTNTFRKYSGFSRGEDTTTVLVTFVGDCLKSAMVDFIRNEEMVDLPLSDL